MNACDSTSPYFSDYAAITQQLRCPVCEGQMIASSDAPFALHVKRSVCEQLMQGKSNPEIMQFIAQEYGEDLRTSNAPELIPLPFIILLLLISMMLLTYFASRRHC